MALPISRWNGLCWVCGHGFPSDDELLIHVMTHPGRHPDDHIRAAEAQKRLAAHAALALDEDDFSSY